MAIDRLESLLQRFSVSARMFHSGPLCGLNDFEPQAGLGQLHLIRRGPVEVSHGNSAPGEAREQVIDTPSLLFYPRPHWHRFVTDAQTGADMACANVVIGAGPSSPIAQALPPVVVMPLHEVAGAAAVLELLFDEAFAQRCGRRHVVDRLFEVVLVLVLRALMERGRVDHGVLAGLSHPQLSRALTAMHDAPAQPWSLESLAERASMSRSHFAATFVQVVGTGAGDYLAGYRIALAQDALRRGVPLKQVADAVGYGSTAALSRAFSARCGQSPRAWQKAQTAGASA